MDFSLTPELLAIQDLVGTFVEREFSPLEGEIDVHVLDESGLRRNQVGQIGGFGNPAGLAVEPVDAVRADGKNVGDRSGSAGY